MSTRPDVAPEAGHGMAGAVDRNLDPHPHDPYPELGWCDPEKSSARRACRVGVRSAWRPHCRPDRAQCVTPRGMPRLSAGPTLRRGLRKSGRGRSPAHLIEQPDRLQRPRPTGWTAILHATAARRPAEIARSRSQRRGATRPLLVRSHDRMRATADHDSIRPPAAACPDAGACVVLEPSGGIDNPTPRGRPERPGCRPPSRSPGRPAIGAARLALTSRPRPREVDAATRPDGRSTRGRSPATAGRSKDLEAGPPYQRHSRPRGGPVRIGQLETPAGVSGRPGHAPLILLDHVPSPIDQHRARLRGAVR